MRDNSRNNLINNLRKRKYFITRFIRNFFLIKSRLYWHLNFLLKKKNAVKTLHDFVGNSLSSEEEKNYLSRMKFAMVNYHWDFNEYFLFHFDELDDAGRKSFVVESQKDVFSDMVNPYKCQIYFLNKWLTYNKFKQFYNRDILLCNSKNKTQAIEFMKKHKCFIIKPLSASLGHGVQKISLSTEDEINVVLDKLLSSHPTDFLLEEFIQQDERIGLLHPESVNTLRVNTFMCKSGVKIFQTGLRIGRGDSVVDNAGAGGIRSAIDHDTGRITKAVDKLGHEYEVHPDNGIKLIGYQVPRFSEAIELAKKLATIVPGNRYTGWDLALTKDGWVMVEGNCAAQIAGCQIGEKKGVREEFEALIKDVIE